MTLFQGYREVQQWKIKVSYIIHDVIKKKNHMTVVLSIEKVIFLKVIFQYPENKRLNLMTNSQKTFL